MNGGRFTPPGARAGRPLRVDERRGDLHARADPAAGRRSTRRRRTAATSSAAGSRTSRSTRRRPATSTPRSSTTASTALPARTATPTSTRSSPPPAAGRRELVDARGRSSRSLRTARPCIYVGDTGDGATADFYTRRRRERGGGNAVTGGRTAVDEAVRLDQRHAGLRRRSTTASAQCSYDMPVYSPPGAPGRGLHRRRDAVRRDLRRADRSAPTAARPALAGRRRRASPT